MAKRGADRTEERDHPALGASWNPAFGAEGPTHGIAYIYGATCPTQGKRVALVLPRCNTQGMNLDLAETSAAVAPGTHAVLLLNQAGWHGSGALIVPANITLMPLPSKCPKLNPVENIWQLMRDNWLSNRILKSDADILDHCCFAWNRLVDRPWRIMSIGRRSWANG